MRKTILCIFFILKNGKLTSATGINYANVCIGLLCIIYSTAASWEGETGGQAWSYREPCSAFLTPFPGRLGFFQASPVWRKAQGGPVRVRSNTVVDSCTQSKLCSICRASCGIRYYPALTDACSASVFENLQFPQASWAIDSTAEL